MRRFLRRSVVDAESRKSGSRSGRHENHQSTSVVAGFKADDDGSGLGTETFPVPEPQSDCNEGKDRLETIPEKLPEKPRSRHSDSGCDSEPGARERRPWRRRRNKVLRRQHELTSSGTSHESSSMSLERFSRQRSSLRSFRVRSGQFLRRRMRPSCLKSRSDDDAAYGPARQRTVSERSWMTIGGWLAAPTMISVLSDETDGPLRSRQSSRSDVTTLPSSFDMSVWNDNGFSFDSSISAPFSSLSHDQTTSAYRRALTGIVNPIGCADDRPGFSPLDLARHLRDVFQFDEKEHRCLVEQVKQCKRRNNVIVKVNVIEAKELRCCTSAESCTPYYCVFDLVNTRSPKSSPNESPRASPIPRRRLSKVSFCDCDEIYQTAMLKTHNGHVVWDEKFEIESLDMFNDELNVSILSSSFLQKEQTRRASFVNILRHLRLSVDAGRNSGGGGFLGQFRVPLKEIPAGGCDCWFSLYRDKKKKSIQPGLCRLRLQLAAKRGTDSVDGRNDDVIVDYHLIVRHLYMHALRTHNSTHSSGSEETGEESFAMLPERSSFILDQFVAHHNIDDFTQHLVHLAVLLKTRSNPMFHDCISETVIKSRVSLLTAEYDRMTVENSVDRCAVTALERRILDESLSLYLQAILSDFKNRVSLPTLFPPNDLQLEELNSLVSNSVNLLCLPIWSTEHDSSQSRQEFSTVITHHLQECVRSWLQHQLGALHSADADPVLPMTRQFITVVYDAATVLTPISSVSQYFARLGIDYFKTASITCDSKLSTKAQELTLESDRYQITYNRFGVNIRESSITTLDHYFALRKLHTTIRGNVSGRELFRISISNYQEWFKVAITFWLQTFREECMRRMEKALEIEKDVVQVTSLVKYSNSVVDVLSCFTKMTSEWREIDFADADISLLGVTKITDTICDCVKLYLEKVINILESNGYYDYIDNQQFDVTDQLCITLNNISHVSGYLSKLSSLLHWDIVAQQLSVKHENEAVGQTTLRSLTSLVSATNEDVTVQSRVLSQRIIEKIVVDMKKYTLAFTRCHNGLPSDVDTLMDYLDNNLQVLYKKLEATIYPLFSEEILKAEIIILLENLEIGQAPTYYEKILDYVKMISGYFYIGGLEAAVLAGCQLSRKLMTILQMNSLPSEQLILLYYQSLVNSSVSSSAYSSSLEHFGDLVVKVGYRKVTEDIANIFVDVVQARGIPGMSTSDVSCPFVSVELCPVTMFPDAVPHRTEVRTSTVNPVYDEKFEFTNIGEQFRSMPGTVVIFSVWHYEALLPNTFLGEVVLPLCDLRELSAVQTVDDLPAVMLKLRRPKEPRFGPYKVLKERCDNDKTARILLEQRSQTVAFRTRCRLCRPVKSIVATITGKKLEVTGRKDTVCTSDSRRTADSVSTPTE